jgi:hypothetical protein
MRAGSLYVRLKLAEAVCDAVEQWKEQVEMHGGTYHPEHYRLLASTLEAYRAATKEPK